MGVACIAENKVRNLIIGSIVVCCLSATGLKAYSIVRLFNRLPEFDKKLDLLEGEEKEKFKVKKKSEENMLWYQIIGGLVSITVLFVLALFINITVGKMYWRYKLGKLLTSASDDNKDVIAGRRNQALKA